MFLPDYFEIPLSQAVFPIKYVIWSLIGIAFIGISFPSIYNTLTLAGLNPFSGKKVKAEKQFSEGNGDCPDGSFNNIHKHQP